MTNTFHQAGLEIQTPSDAWAPVPVSPAGAAGDDDEAPPPILVNIGDLLSYWTNGLLRSTVHRVAFTAAAGTGGAKEGAEAESTADPRYSIVYFCHPADDTPLAAVPSERVRRRFSERGVAHGRGNPPHAERDEEEEGGRVLTAKEHLQSRLRATYLQMYGGGQEGKGESA